MAHWGEYGMDMKWHYTMGIKLRSIMEDGVIKPATARVPQGEKPVVWFSTNQEWEPTANKSWQNSDGQIMIGDKDKTAELGLGLVRIGVEPDTAPYDWHTIKKASGMSGKMANGLYRVGIDCGSRPGDWWEPSSQFRVEVSLKVLWVPFEREG